jgi:hypothetical protein
VDFPVDEGLAAAGSIRSTVASGCARAFVVWADGGIVRADGAAEGARVSEPEQRRAVIEDADWDDNWDDRREEPDCCVDCGREVIAYINDHTCNACGNSVCDKCVDDDDFGNDYCGACAGGFEP